MKQTGVAMRWIDCFDKTASQELHAHDVEFARAMALGPRRGPDDTILTRIQFLREQDAKAVKH